MKTITYDPLAGTHIKDACGEAVSIAIKKDARVTFSFNGVNLTASPDTSRSELERQFSSEMERVRKEWEASPECAVEKKKRNTDIERRQRETDHFMDGIERVVATCSLDDVMDCLRPFVQNADHIGVKFDKGKLANIFKGAGYKNNMHVGLPPEAFNARKIMGEYILGQVVNCLESGMPPHPVTLSFIEKYFALPA